MISFIWAMDNNQVIGNNNELPWHLPADLQYFKRVTMGHPIVMGRKTFESIGRPLPGRENIIITRNPAYTNENCTVIHSVDELLQYCQKNAEEEYFVIGGAELFQQLLPYADRLYVTKIHEQFVGDTFFPPIDLNDWKLNSREKGQKDDKNPYDYEFLMFTKQL